jgi:tRNA(Ser,Leu) C12 N-acetylase TAN1
MKDWNVVVTIYQAGFRRALRACQEYGQAERSPYHNVMVMKVEDPIALLRDVERRTEENPGLYDAIARVAPAARAFDFQSAEEFKQGVLSIMFEWLPCLKGRPFHVRLHRRGPNLDLRSQDAERYFDDAVIDATGKAGLPARISFGDPDIVIVIDTIDDRAGLAMWTREDLARHRLLRPD